MEYLKKRFAALSVNPLFSKMEFSTNFDKLQEWMPLVMEGRDKEEKLAATRMDIGTDVNFGALTKGMVTHSEMLSNLVRCQRDWEANWRVRKWFANE